MINEKPKMIKKQNPSRRLYIAIGIIMAIFAAITFIVLFKLIVKKPDVSHDVPFDISVIDDNIIDSAEINPNNATVMDGLTYTRKSDVYNFLVAGEALQLQTDAMMIVNYDVANSKISVMQLPRDTYVNIGRNFHTLNCYFVGEYNTGVKKGADKSTLRAESMKSFVSLIEQNLNISIDYWVLVNLAAFREIVDIIGGVEVTVEHDMFYEDPDQDLYINLTAGTQILNGDKAEQFVRFREGYALQDKGRMDAQKIFLTALMTKLKSSISVTNVAPLIQQIFTNVTTSISPKDSIYFATELLKADLSNINMMSLPVSSIYDSGWYEIMNRADALKMINKHMNVYNEDILDKIFDKNKIFTNDKKTILNNSYLSDSGIDHEGVTAAEINENSIHIQPQASKSN
jgi:cell envelope-related function transcriptional attenuator common domain